ncbi:MAG: hypothetical protein ACREUC_18255, partial [Steroidobacteraceae bacterium]
MNQCIHRSRAALTIALPLAVSGALAQDPPAPPPLSGVQVGDINRNVDPCTDFFEFANGRWRAENPIPASMPRWSRRWAAGEATKDHLREILEAAAATRALRGTAEQLTGDFYAGCMDEAQADRLGAKPVEPLLAEIDAVRNGTDVQRLIARLHRIAIPVPFGLFADADYRNPSIVIAHFYA